MGRSSPKAVRTSRSATWSGLRPSRRVCPWLRRAFPLTYVPSRTTIVATTSAIRGISTGERVRMRSAHIGKAPPAVRPSYPYRLPRR